MGENREVGMATERIKPVIPDCYKSVSANAMMDYKEVLRILGLSSKGSLYSRIERHQFPQPDAEGKKKFAGQTYRGNCVYWKMKTIRDYVKNFDKWMAGEMATLPKTEG